MVTAVLLAGGLVALSPAPASASSGESAARVNGARAASGLAGLVMSGDLNAIAQRHASAMAARGSIYHNGSVGSQACCWSRIGENVGVGASVAEVHDAFMQSSSHRGNILSTAYGEIGVGVAEGKDGRVYVDQVFRQRVPSAGSGRVSRPPGEPAPPAVGSRPTQPVVRPHVRTDPVVVLERRLERVVKVRTKAPPDPVAAAYAFASLMARVTRG